METDLWFRAGERGSTRRYTQAQYALSCMRRHTGTQVHRVNSDAPLLCHTHVTENMEDPPSPGASFVLDDVKSDVVKVFATKNVGSRTELRNDPTRKKVLDVHKPIKRV